MNAEAIRQHQEHLARQKRLGIGSKPPQSKEVPNAISVGIRMSDAELKLMRTRARLLEEDEARREARRFARDSRADEILRKRKKAEAKRREREAGKAARRAMLANLPSWKDIEALVPRWSMPLDNVAGLVLGKFPGISMGDVRARDRTAQLFRARYLIAKAARANGATYSEIARFLDRHHAAVMSMLKRERKEQL